MTNKQKFESEERRQELFGNAIWHCVVCGGPLAVHGTAQLAHRVPKKKSLIDKWGPEVIHHPLNTLPTCSLKCNAMASIGTLTTAYTDLMDRIIRVNTGRDPRPDMTEEYRLIREQFAKEREE